MTLSQPSIILVPVCLLGLFRSMLNKIKKHLSSKEIYADVKSSDSTTVASDKVDSLFGSKNVSFINGLASKNFYKTIYRFRLLLLALFMSCSFAISYQFYTNNLPITPPDYFPISVDNVETLSSYNGFIANQVCFSTLMLHYESGLEDRGLNVFSVFSEKPSYVIKLDDEGKFFCVLSNYDSTQQSINDIKKSLLYKIAAINFIVIAFFYYLISRKYVK